MSRWIFGLNFIFVVMYGNFFERNLIYYIIVVWIHNCLKRGSGSLILGQDQDPDPVPDLDPQHCPVQDRGIPGWTPTAPGGSVRRWGELYPHPPAPESGNRPGSVHQHSLTTDELPILKVAGPWDIFLYSMFSLIRTLWKCAYGF
jgi:hypothetical protein